MQDRIREVRFVDDIVPKDIYNCRLPTANHRYRETKQQVVLKQQWVVQVSSVRPSFTAIISYAHVSCLLIL